jgi:hypothetical protein
VGSAGRVFDDLRTGPAKPEPELRQDCRRRAGAALRRRGRPDLPSADFRNLRFGRKVFGQLGQIFESHNY